MFKNRHDGLPSYTPVKFSYPHVDDDKYFKPRQESWWSTTAITRTARVYLTAIMANKETRNVFFFLLLNLSFTGVEFLYGIWSNSLGLTADAVHMLFDSTAIICSLIASVITKWDPTSKYTYGFGRVETLTGFVNALALVFASGNIIWEAFERLFSPQELNSDKLLLVSVLGLLVNLVGIFAFDHGGSHGHHGHSHDHHDHGHSHGHGDHSSGLKNPLMHGMFLHVLADTLGSAGVIVSSILIQMFGWTWSDPLCSLFIAVLILGSIWPLLISSGNILLQAVPESIESDIPEILSQIQRVENVILVGETHFWEVYTGQLVGSVSVTVKPEANEQIIRHTIEQILKRSHIRHVTVQIDKPLPDGYQPNFYGENEHRHDHRDHHGHSHDHHGSHDHSHASHQHGSASVYSTPMATPAQSHFPSQVLSAPQAQMYSQSHSHVSADNSFNRAHHSHQH